MRRARSRSPRLNFAGARISHAARSKSPNPWWLWRQAPQKLLRPADCKCVLKCWCTRLDVSLRTEKLDNSKEGFWYCASKRGWQRKIIQTGRIYEPWKGLHVCLSFKLFSTWWPNVYSLWNKTILNAYNMYHQLVTKNYSAIFIGGI